MIEHDELLARIEARIERLDDKADALVLKQQELAAYQKTANGNLAAIKADVIDLKGWRYQRELALARSEGVEAGRTDRVLSQHQWRVIQWALGATGAGVVAIIGDIIRSHVG